SLPSASSSGERTNILDSAFTATSAVCVTGLVTLDTSTHWSRFGQTVIIILIQIGGLGFMSFATLIAIFLKRKISLKSRLVMQEAMNTFSIQGLVKMVQYIFGFTFAVEIIGALLLSIEFVPTYGLGTGLFYSMFHSISAFCNAGFDLFGTSLVTYNKNVFVILVISVIIIIGGLGFTVWLDLYRFKNIKKLSIHSKLVILVSTVLIFGGAILMFIFEFNNAETIGNMMIKNKVLNSFFSSVTTRTAGFNSISINYMSTAGKFLNISLMFIGGSPGSTAGGLKTTTIGIVVLTVISVIKGREDTEVFGRRFSKSLVYKAFTLLFIGMGLIIIVTMMLSYTEKGVSFMDLLYETTSAFGTAGLSTGLTPKLSNIGKILIMLMMYFGRVGPLTVVLAMARKRKKSGYKYPEGKILIG
ncbi:MAG: TrkH family potassium uptake protein, partial [Clostridium sp.]